MTLFTEFVGGSANATPFISQSETSECALACLAMAAGGHGLKVNLATLRHRFNISLKGATLSQISGIAKSMNLRVRPLRATLDELTEVACPAILHWNLNHFVVLVKRTRSLRGQVRFVIHDPAAGVLSLTPSEVSKHFTGIVVEIDRTEQFQSDRQVQHLKISQLWSRMTGFWASVRNLLLLSIIIQAISLFSPFYLQLAVDDALPGSDRQMLSALALGFAGLAVLSYATTWLRACLSLSFSTSLTYQLVNNLFGHLMRLPASWFEKRHVGDVISRFNSTQPISQLLSQGMLTAAMDGILASATLVLMFVYSPILALIACGALLLYLAARLLFFESLRLKNVSSIAAAARENSVFIETARGIQTIKAFGEEVGRQQIWQRAKVDAVNAQFKLGRLSAGFDSVGQFIVSAEQVFFVFIATTMAIKGSFTIGMIFAFQAYKQQFVNAGIRLIEQVINWKVLRVHLGRISDIALGPCENQRDQGVQIDGDAGPIHLNNVHFRYGLGEPSILNGVSLVVRPGEFVVLIGASGGGKTTVGKIITGLLEPTAGEVMLGGRPLSHYSLSSLRRAIAIVSQDDVLYAGTIADNIAFWDQELSLERVMEAAKAACIHDDIVRTPLGYDTLVGDMGAALSGGQKSRILIARALYRKPQVLLLDEATAQLDPAVEREVVENISRLSLTRIFITHRSQPARYADRIIRVDKGCALQVRQASGVQPVAV